MKNNEWIEPKADIYHSSFFILHSSHLDCHFSPFYLAAVDAVEDR
jgi:hypothetical protein